VNRSIIRGAGAFAIAVSIAIGAASAQAPAVNPGQAGQAAVEQKQRLDQPLNNQQVWKEVRSGEQQTTNVRGRETNVLIQSEGQTWRAIRVPIATAGGWLLALTALVIGGFYAWRGPIELDGKPTGRVIQRFTAVKRAAHWAMALSFVALAVTGLVTTFGKAVLLPLIGYTLFSWLATISTLVHNFTGPLFAVAVPVFIVLFVRDNLPKAYDVQWLVKFGGMLDRSGATHVPSGKFNAGEKGQFWLMVCVLSVVLIVTGLILNFRISIRPLDDADRQRDSHDRVDARDRDGHGSHLPRHDRHVRRVRGDALRLRRRDVGEGAPRVLVQRRCRRQGGSRCGAGCRTRHSADGRHGMTMNGRTGK